MKDKLVKTHHKKVYYRLRTLLFAFAISVGIVAIGATPIAISFMVAEPISASKAPDTLELTEDSSNEGSPLVEQEDINNAY